MSACNCQLANSPMGRTGTPSPVQVLTMSETYFFEDLFSLASSAGLSEFRTVCGRTRVRAIPVTRLLSSSDSRWRCAGAVRSTSVFAVLGIGAGRAQGVKQSTPLRCQVCQPHSAGVVISYLKLPAVKSPLMPKAV